MLNNTYLCLVLRAFRQIGLQKWNATEKILTDGEN